MIEELVVLVLQFVFEFLFNLFVWFPWDMFVWWRERKAPLERRASEAWVVPMGGLLFGAVVGGISLLVLPTVLLGHEYARLANVLVTPLLCAALAGRLARRRIKRGQISSQGLHFWFALTFSMALLMVRFVWANRAM